MSNYEHTENEYYNRIMQSLEAGSQEYDRIMQAGLAPSQRRARLRRLACTAVAAGIALMCVGTWMLRPAGEEADAPRYASTGAEVVVMALPSSGDRVLVVPGSALAGEDWQPGQMTETAHRMLETLAMQK